MLRSIQRNSCTSKRSERKSVFFFSMCLLAVSRLGLVLGVRHAVLCLHSHRHHSYVQVSHHNYKSGPRRRFSYPHERSWSFPLSCFFFSLSFPNLSLSLSLSLLLPTSHIVFSHDSHLLGLIAPVLSANASRIHISQFCNLSQLLVPQTPWSRAVEFSDWFWNRGESMSLLYFKTKNSVFRSVNFAISDNSYSFANSACLCRLQVSSQGHAGNPRFPCRQHCHHGSHHSPLQRALEWHRNDVAPEEPITRRRLPGEGLLQAVVSMWTLPRWTRSWVCPPSPGGVLPPSVPTRCEGCVCLRRLVFGLALSISYSLWIVRLES